MFKIQNDTIPKNVHLGQQMETLKFVYYQENNMWVGWLEEYPDYRTQGMSLDELKENLIDLHKDLTSGKSGVW